MTMADQAIIEPLWWQLRDHNSLTFFGHTVPSSKVVREICHRLRLASAAFVDRVPREDLLGLSRLSWGLVLVFRHQMELQLVAASERLVADEAAELSDRLL